MVAAVSQETPGVALSASRKESLRLLTAGLFDAVTPPVAQSASSNHSLRPDDGAGSHSAPESADSASSPISKEEGTKLAAQLEKVLDALQEEQSESKAPKRYKVSFITGGAETGLDKSAPRFQIIDENGDVVREYPPTKSNLDLIKKVTAPGTPPQGLLVDNVA